MAQSEEGEVARAWDDRRAAKIALGAVAAIYVSAVFLDAAKSGLSRTHLHLPAPVAYFTQVAALFPGASRHALDYRAEGYRCADGSFTELDVRPWFRVDADTKESRFYRLIHFYGEHTHPHRPTMRALDEFLVSRFNEAARKEGRALIGGVRITKLAVPFGKPGGTEERYRKKPLAEYPEAQQKVLYFTPESRREERCKWQAR
jgi:hypothetical protein